MAWEAYVSPDPVDNIFSRYWLLEQMKLGEAFEEQHGRAIMAELEYATNTTVKWMSEYETLDLTQQTIFDQAEYAWKLCGGDAIISEYERAITEGRAGKFNLLTRKIQNLKRTIDDTVNASLFSDGTGTSSKEIGGLQLIVDTTPATGTVGQINAANFSFWRNQQTSGAQTTSPYDNLRASVRSIYNLCSNGIGLENPQYMVTTRTVFEAYEGLLVAVERRERTSANDRAVGDYNKRHLMYADVPVAYDDDCPSAQWFVLNRRNLKLVWARWQKAFPPGSPVNQFIDVVKILTIANLVSDNRRRLGVVSAIS